MDFRQYDPAIARFTSIDPITHWKYSPYLAFDNNPVFWADPSGANSIYNFKTGQYVINGKVVTQDEAIAYANNGGNADGSNNNTPNDNKSDTNTDYKDPLSSENNGISPTDPKEDIKEYEKNERILYKNSMMLHALSKLTTKGQVQSTMMMVIEEWREMGVIITPKEEKSMIDDIDDGLTALGITVTTAAPYVKIAATIISTPLAVQNIYLDRVNEITLKPRIKRDSPHYYHNNIQRIPYYDVGGPPPYNNGGGGANGGW